MEKLNRVYSDRYSKKIAKLARGLLLLEDLSEDLDLSQVSVRIRGDTIEVCVPRHVAVESGEDLVISSACIGDKLERAYEYVARLFVEYSKRVLTPYVLKEREYMLMVLESGDCIMLEGEEDRVVVPKLRGVLFAAHTHPRAPPFLSRKDLGSFIDLVTERGFVFAVVGSSGALYLYRRALIGEDDYVELMKLYNSKRSYYTVELLIDALPRSIGVGIA